MRRWRGVSHGFAIAYRRAATPIVWLRAIVGSGKPRLLRDLQRYESFPASGWRFLDEPAVPELDAALATCDRDPSGLPILIASHAAGEIADTMLKSALYGWVDVIDESELFLNAADARGNGSLEVLSATGGWPLLVDGYLTGRALETMQMLPAFLDRDVLPDLPAPVVTALFGALPAPLSMQAVEYLFGATPTLHPLLRATDEGVTVAGSGCVRHS